jgi:hypothetical protein
MRQSFQPNKLMKIVSKRLLQLTAATMLLAATEHSLRADTIVMDPDGAGNAPKVSFNSFQFGAGNSLSAGAIPFTNGANFQFLFQAQLNSVVTSTGAQVVPIGLNASSAVGGVAPYEITMVGSVTETVTNLNSAQPPPRVAYKLATQSTSSFIEIYFDGNQNANPLQGTGYNDGTLILRGTPIVANPNVGTFSLTDPTPSATPAFDSFAPSDYPNTASVLGGGATRLDVMVTAVDPAFFVAPGQGDAGRAVHVGDIVTLDISQSAPFDKVNASHRFTTAPNTGTSSGPSPTATPNIGSTNGTAGTDLQTQSLIAASVKAATAGSPTPTPTPSPTGTPHGTPTPTPTATPLKVSVTASSTSINPGQDSAITFTVKPVGAVHPDLTVNYTLTGSAVLNTDYTVTGTARQVLIPAANGSVNVGLHALPTNVKDSTGKTVKITVAPGTGYNVPVQPDANSVSVLINHPGSTSTPTPTPSITPTPTPTATPSPTVFPAIKVNIVAAPTSISAGHTSTITFTVKPLGAAHPDLTVNYTLGGTAVLNTDYVLNGTPGQISIPSTFGASTVTLRTFSTVTKNKTATITVAPGTGYSVPTQPDAMEAMIAITGSGG